MNQKWNDHHSYVMRLLVEGLNHKQIMDRIGKSYWHVNNYIKDIYEHCGISTPNQRVGLVHWYLRQCSPQERDRILNGGRAG